MEKPSYTSRRSLLNLIMGGCTGLSIGALSIRPLRAETIPGPADLAPPESAGVASVIDGDTLALVDGTVLRLAGIEAPKRDLKPGDPRMAALADAATAALKSLVGTEPIASRADAGKRDRTGRRLAQVFNSKGDWLQAALVIAGHARVRGDGRNRLGLKTLLELEAKARGADQGMWRHPAFQVRDALDPNLGRFEGSFQIIKGQVFAAAVVGGTGYINFSPDRETDLTLVLKKPALVLFQEAMIALDSLNSKWIRCRGWIEVYQGPRIELSHPEQIEVLES